MTQLSNAYVCDIMGWVGGWWWWVNVLVPGNLISRNELNWNVYFVFLLVQSVLWLCARCKLLGTWNGPCKWTMSHGIWVLGRVHMDFTHYKAVCDYGASRIRIYIVNRCRLPMNSACLVLPSRLVLQHRAVDDMIYVNSSSQGQNGLHFADDISKCISMNEKSFILINISLKFVP